MTLSSTSDHAGPQRPARARRSDAGTLRCSGRDLELLRVVGERYTVTQLARMMRCSPHAARWLRSRWERAGWARGRALLVGEPVFVWLTRRGQSLAGIDYSVWRPNGGMLAHIAAVTDVRLHVLDRHPGAEWVCERELHRELASEPGGVSATGRTARRDRWPRGRRRGRADAQAPSPDRADHARARRPLRLGHVLRRARAAPRPSAARGRDRRERVQVLDADPTPYLGMLAMAAGLFFSAPALLVGIGLARIARRATLAFAALALQEPDECGCGGRGSSLRCNAGSGPATGMGCSCTPGNRFRRRGRHPDLVAARGAAVLRRRAGHRHLSPTVSRGTARARRAPRRALP